MPNFTPPYSIASAWRYLADFERLFLVAMSALTLYFLFSAAVIIVFYWDCRSGPHKGDGAYIERTVATLRKRCTRLRRLSEAAFFLFGVVLFWSLLGAYYTIGSSSHTPVGWLVLTNFQVHFVFALNVFFLFLLLHVLGWLIANRVDVCIVPVHPGKS
jgi:hypothetical protein